MAPRGRSIERPLLINGYAYLAISFPKQREWTQEESLRNNDRTATNLKPFSTQQLNALSQQRNN
jgi:hypothetical protein